MLSISHVITHLILNMALKTGHCSFHFTDEKTEAWRLCHPPKVTQLVGGKAWFNPGGPTPEPVLTSC